MWGDDSSLQEPLRCGEMMAVLRSTIDLGDDSSFSEPLRSREMIAVSGNSIDLGRDWLVQGAT